jgi:hypothetical protein
MGVPPSKLGFVCKPDMPPHINILFRSRPGLPFRQIPVKKHKTHYDGMFSNISDYKKLFENSKEVTKSEKEPLYETKIKKIVIKTEKNKRLNNEKLPECKYLVVNFNLINI